ncbi:hypothetical protein CPB83DRAFT_695 [Crepidotus variabilis]|uniref:Uncharacterized protein n=1 Tax=Crepidotus variabilis TaxID=179855 RepID=A0A9P6EUM4_9AGAR|nr:hypothetical protein CPB83DRAFT_695 [Crepidotus variabilis]
MMTTPLKESLSSLICREPWNWDSLDENQIHFTDETKGQLVCRHELNVWIAAEFDWRALSGTALDTVITVDDQNPSSVIAELEIELTLTRRHIPRLGQADMSQFIINEFLLEASAFEPKVYTLRLESGIFRSDYDEMRVDLGEVELPYTPRYGLRLLFDRSPYPKRDQWKVPEGAPDAMKFWEWKVFCGRKL